MHEEINFKFPQKWKRGDDLYCSFMNEGKLIALKCRWCFIQDDAIVYQTDYPQEEYDMLICKDTPLEWFSDATCITSVKCNQSGL